MLLSLPPSLPRHWFVSISIRHDFPPWLITSTMIIISISIISWNIIIIILWSQSVLTFLICSQLSFSFFLSFAVVAVVVCCIYPAVNCGPNARRNTFSLCFFVFWEHILTIFNVHVCAAICSSIALSALGACALGASDLAPSVLKVWWPSEWDTAERDERNKGEGRGGKEMMLSCVNKAYCLVSVVRHRFEYSRSRLQWMQ